MTSPAPTPIMFYVYVLKSRINGKLYIGSTIDLKKRIIEHNSGKVQSTKSRKPFILIYSEGYAAEQDARMRESRLKLRSKAFTQLRKRIMKSLEI